MFPKHLGAYVVDDVLGRGGMGIVYRAFTPVGEPVAIKVLRADQLQADSAGRFVREASIRIDHPNVVRVLDTGKSSDGDLFIVLELLDGESLETRLQRGTLSASETAGLGVQACRGLAAAHARGVIHRDLKPANLFLCPDGTVKILDFGVAGLLDGDCHLTVSGTVLGTPAFLAPEQARSAHAIDERSDLWALAAVLYRCLAGRAPFQRESVAATLLAALLDNPVPLAEVATGTPAALAAAIERGLARQPERRWQSATAFEAALRSSEFDPASSERSSAWIAIGEQRVVSLLLADELADLELLSREVAARGGVTIPLPNRRAIGLFGKDAWTGQEVQSALSAALAARACAGRMAVTAGWASDCGTGLVGQVLRDAEGGCSAGFAGVAITEQAAAHLRGAFVLRDAGLSFVEAVREQAAGATATEIIGREPERLALRLAVEAFAADKRAAGILVTGPPGIGKSMLRAEVEHLLAQEGIPVVSARCEPRRRHQAFSLFRSGLESVARARGYEAILDRTLALATRQQVAWALSSATISDEPRARKRAQFLGELLGVSMPDTVTLQAARLDARLMHDQLRGAVEDWFCGLCSAGPVALVLEDLQWADDPSLELLADLCDLLSNEPFFVVAVARSEFVDARPHSLGTRDPVRIDLRGLSGPAVVELATAAAGRPLSDDLVRTIDERTAGNPLFVVHIVRALVDRDLLSAVPSSLPLPLTVEAAVQARLDALPSAEHEALKHAAVLGRSFLASEIEALGVANAEPVLGSLARRDLVKARSRGGPSIRRNEYAFRSALVAEIAYEMIAPGAREDLHRCAGGLLEGSNADPEEVALHFERGGLADRAAERYADAALRAAVRGDSSTVLRCSDRALALGCTARRFALRLARADALRFAGRLDEQAVELEGALDAAQTDIECARAMLEQAMWLWSRGRPVEALAVVNLAVDAALATREPEVLTVALCRRGMLANYAGHLSEAEEALAEAERHAPACLPSTRALVAGFRAELAAARGDLAMRRDTYQTVCRLYGETGDLRRAAGAEISLADVHNRLGAYEEAEAALRSALAGCRRVKNRLAEGYALLNLGYALGGLLRREDALAALDEAAVLARSIGEARLALLVRVYRGRVVLLLPRTEDVLSVAQDATDAAAAAQTAGMPGLRAVALAIAARAMLALGKPEAARELAVEALGERDALGSVEEDEAEIFLVAADAFAASGRPEQAAAVARRGRDCLHALAGGIADSECKARFLGNVPAHRRLLDLAAATDR